MSEHECKKCELMKKLGYEGCADFGSSLTDELTDTIIERFKQQNANLENKFTHGEITREELNAAATILVDNFYDVAERLPAMLYVKSNYGKAPYEMIHRVENYFKQIIPKNDPFVMIHDMIEKAIFEVSQEKYEDNSEDDKKPNAPGSNTIN